MHQLQLTLCDAQGQELDTSYPARFGFREFWIDGRDFYLNGTRIFLSSVPLDNAQVGAAWATYEAARESMRRLQSFGINFVYTHNYGCEPGSHLSFEEILRAADDVGMLVAFSQPHFGHYEWDAPDAETTNGYAQHAAFFVQVAAHTPHPIQRSGSTTGWRSFFLLDLTGTAFIVMAVMGQALEHREQPLQASVSISGTKPLGFTPARSYSLMDWSCPQ